MKLEFKYDKFYLEASIVGVIACSLWMGTSALFEIFAPSGNALARIFSPTTVIMGLCCLVSWVLLLKKPYLTIQDDIVTLRTFYILSSVIFSLHDVKKVITFDKKGLFALSDNYSGLAIFLENESVHKIYFRYLNRGDRQQVYKIFLDR